MLRAELEQSQGTGRNLAPQKETLKILRLIARVEERLSVVVDARFYAARRGDGMSPLYCSVWIRGKDFQTAGHGSAGGYGYHKMSAALAYALRDAGVHLYGSICVRDVSPDVNDRPADIAGVGDQAMEASLVAIGNALEGVDMSLHFVG